MNAKTNHRRNARTLKTLSLLYLGLTVVSLLFVHSDSYEPAVSYVLLYFAVSIGVVTAVALLLLPTQQYTGGFSTGAYALYAAFVAMMVFFSGGVSSELYVLYFPLLLASALHGHWRMVMMAVIFTLFTYFLAATPDIMNEGAATGAAALAFFRLAVFALTGVFLVAAARNFAGAADSEDYDYDTDEDGSMLRERVEAELAARKGVPVAVVLVDPGRKVEDVELLLERVRGRIGDPVLLGEGTCFGIVLSGMDDRGVESAARRALAAASSLGAEETRAGAAIYPRDARSANDLLVSAGQALEAAFEIESPSAIVLAGRGTPRAESRYRAAR
ncbi:MAG TPA: hypothetical protein VFJ72_11260 [Rubrobacteraceae bacterium]|nr:hypothetical protein [Rubrobacteraceae bacterium]